MRKERKKLTSNSNLNQPMNHILSNTDLHSAIQHNTALFWLSDRFWPAIICHLRDHQPVLPLKTEQVTPARPFLHVILGSQTKSQIWTPI